MPCLSSLSPSLWSSARRRLAPVSTTCSRKWALLSPASSFRTPKHRIRGRSGMTHRFRPATLSLASGRERAVQTAILVVGIGILGIISYGDVRTRRIPNALSLAIAILGVLRIILVDNPVSAGQTLAAGVALFAAAFLLFWRGAIGGGDAKLVAAMALLVGYHYLFGFLFLMSL